jgi:hypothetical protein
VNCSRCSQTPAQLQLWSNIALCADCRSVLEDRKRQHHAGRIIGPMVAGSLLMATGAVLFPIIGMPGLTLVGVVTGVSVMLSSAYIQERVILRRFCDSKAAMLPAARIPPGTH